MTILHRGKRFVRTDQPAPAVHHPRTVGHKIPIKGQFGTMSGELGTTKVMLYRSTEIAVVYPRRGGVYDRRNLTIEPRPHYVDAAGVFQYKVQCVRCLDYQRRDAFGPDRRKCNGLQSICRTCDAERKRLARAA